MDIAYLKELNEISELNGVIPKGIHIDEISELERRFNNGRLFPKAFREYLFISGEIGGTGVGWNDWEMLHEDLQEFLEITNFTLNRPVFVYDMQDGGSMFSFFYLDEDKEDPDVYLLFSGGYVGEKTPVLKSANGHTFSSLISEAIRRKKNNIPF